MLNIRNLALYTILAGSLATSSGCAKKDQNVETDYNAKKASAETLITQINASMATMKTDHTQWMAALDQAWKKPGADTAKINSLKQQMTKHEGDAQVIMADMDSVKMYSSATSDNADQMKNADDRLGSNFDDLNSKWKSFQDDHASLGKNIQQFAVTTAGDAVKDSTKANGAGTTTTTTPAKHGTAMEKKTVTKTTTTTTETTPVNPANPHQTVVHHSGGAAKVTHN